MNRRKEDSPSQRQPTNRGLLSVRFRNLNTTLCAGAFCVMAIVMTVVFSGISREISVEDARRYASSSAETLTARIAKDAGLISAAARSSVVAEWMADENDPEKKALAYRELSGIVGELYSFNLYATVGESRSEYTVQAGRAVEEFTPFTVLRDDNLEDSWFFECLESEGHYVLSVDIDRVMQRKRVWFDYKVTRNDTVLGILSTGLEFSHVAGELFSQYNNGVRGLLVDKSGMILVDSDLSGDPNYLYAPYMTPIGEEIADPVFLTALSSYLGAVDGSGEQSVIELPSELYHYAAMVPVGFTNWSIVVLFDGSSFFQLSYFLPVGATLLLLLIIFAAVTGAVNYRLIFRPLGLLERSLSRVREGGNEPIYGTARNDELGHLAQTIDNLFSQANVDGLTGIYNRRYMEASLEQTMKLLSRAGGELSVLMLDIDNFKKYNDTYGHDQGDVCLRAVARALAASVRRAGDFVARYGGEEFAAVLPNTDEAGVRAVAESMLKSVRALEIPHENSGTAPFVTVSAGAATGKVLPGQSWEIYMKQADEALYLSKKNGRNRCTFVS